MDCSTPGFPVLHCLSEFAQTHVHWVNALLFLPSTLPSFRVFSKELALCIRWPKYWSFSFSISTFNKYSVLISFWIDWFGHSSRESQESSPMPQFTNINSLVLSLLYGPTPKSIHDYWKNHHFDIQTFVSKVMSLLFNVVQVYHPFSSKEKASFSFVLAVTICSDFGAPQIKVSHCFHGSLTICHEVMGPNAMILVFLMLIFKPPFSLSSFTFIKRFFSFSLSAIRVLSSAWGYWYFSQQSWFQLLVVPAWHSHDVLCIDVNIQLWCTSFPIWNQSVIPNLVQTAASWSAYRFLMRQVR